MPDRQWATCRAAAAGSAKPSAVELRLQDVGVVRQTLRSSGARLSKIAPDRSTCGRRPVEQFFAARQPVQLCDIVERVRARRKQVRLRVLDHLHAMLDRPQQAVGVGEIAAHASRRAVRPRCSASIASSVARRPDRRVASAVDHLLDLDEEFDFADAAAAAFEVEARADLGALGEMVADARAKSAAPRRSRRSRASAATRRAGSSRGSAARARHRLRAARARMNAARSHGRALEFVVRNSRVDRQRRSA